MITFAGCVLPGLVFGGEDTTPPKLKSLQFTPNSIDTSTGAVEVTLSFSVTDDASGATFFEATFVEASGVARQSASVKFAPTVEGTNSVKITFPQFSSSGTWTLSNVFLGDAAGNTLVLDADGLISSGFPTRLEVKSVRDTVSPKLTSLEFSPAQVDTSAGPADVKVNYTATDDLSGVNYIELSFVSPSGVARRSGSAKLQAAQSVSKSMNLTFPRLSEAGQWTLSAVFLSDAAGNTLVLNAEGIAGLGFRTALDVKSSSDTTSPTLTSLRFAPDTIDTSGGSATVEVNFAAADDLSGVKSIEVVFVSPSGISHQRGVEVFSPAKEVTGSVKLTFPQSSEPGAWRLGSVMVTDDAGNTCLLDADALAPRAGALQVR